MKTILTLFIGIMLTGFTGLANFQNPLKIPVRIYLEHFKNLDKNQLSVRVLTKIDKRYKPTAGIKVALYATEIEATHLLGTVITTTDGTGIYTFSKEQRELAESMKTATYYAVVNENDTLKAKKVEVTIKKVNLSVQYFIKDSVKQIQAHVSETDSTGNEIPQKKVKIKFLVARPLSPLPIGGDYNATDKKGNVSVEFPDDLPGGAEGYVKLLVRIVENDDYGTVETSEVKQWGVPTHYSDMTAQRSLWASGANAPIPLLIAIFSLVAVVWGMIFYMIYKILVIRKIGM
ncbi:MAG: hypothetical protein L3J06_03420 [Cyclobacteriaceae bacterium]|nr:hypothetical protein [Cyclobacteriaceae bacterium]